MITTQTAIALAKSSDSIGVVAGAGKPNEGKKPWEQNPRANLATLAETVGALGRQEVYRICERHAARLVKLAIGTLR